MLYVAVFWRLPGEQITRHEWAKIPSGPFSLSTQKNSLSVTGTIQAAAFRNKDTLSKTLSYMMDYFQPLWLLMMDLCLKLFDVTKDKILSFFVGPITHENFRGVLLEHYGALQSMDKASIGRARQREEARTTWLCKLLQVRKAPEAGTGQPALSHRTKGSLWSCVIWRYHNNIC